MGLGRPNPPKATGSNKHSNAGPCPATTSAKTSLRAAVIPPILQTLAASLVVALLLPGMSRAEDAPIEASTETKCSKPDPVVTRTWVDGIGTGYHRGTVTWGMGLSHSFGEPLFGSEERQDLWLGNVNFGLVLDEPLLTHTPLKGNFEFLGVLTGGAEGNDNKGYLVAVTPGIRYYFATGTRWIPFVSGYAGAAITDMDDPDLDGTFQYDLGFGGGLRWYAGPRTAVALEYSILHLSNGGISDNAHGINTRMLTLGITRHF